jgi:hypothetical protein
MKTPMILTGMICAFLMAEINAVTVELWPAERRRNNTVYLIGNEQNHLMFNLSNRTNLGTHKIKFPENIVKPVILTVDLPGKIDFLGARVFRDKRFSSDIKKEQIKHHGVAYNRYIIQLNREENRSLRIKNRVIKNKYNYYILVWLKSPDKFTGKVYWNLKYGDKIMAEASSNMQTVGTIDPKLKLPNKFRWNISAGLIYTVPDNDYKRFADFCRRLGINSASVNYGGPISAERKAAFDALRQAGIKNIANRGGSFGKYLSSGFRQKKTMANGGLEAATAKAAEQINSAYERNLFKNVAGNFDGFNFDYEPGGPQGWPGFDDTKTIAQFAKKFGLKKTPSQKELKSKYRKAYIAYRMELLSRPVFAVEKMLAAVKPMELAVEQGSGVNPHIDYHAYDKAIRWHGPMIYTSSPIDYYQRVLAVTKYIDPKKTMPVNSSGWTFAGATRQSPQDMVMDTVGTAAAGCGAISHWPGLMWTDEGEFYGFYQGLTIVAQGEDFYFDGKPSNEFKVKGLPFKSKKINLGFKVLDVSQPDWKTSLFFHEHKLKNETLITILNFNKEYDAFVEIAGKQLVGKYLVNPVDKTYLRLNSPKVTIKVAKFSPRLWIITKNNQRIAGCQQLDNNNIITAFKNAKQQFLAGSSKTKVQLGAKGKISLNYGQVDFGENPTIALNVSTPTQKVSFSKSGGRIISWTAKKRQFVGGKNFSNDGFCMDLLWLPTGSRWSGDQISDMQLVKCMNNGKAAIIEYAGEFKKGLPGLRIVKTYTIPATGSTVKVNVRLINGTPLPVTVSYWNHNVLPSRGYSFVSKDINYEQQGNSIFVAADLPEKFKQSICMPKHIKDTIGREYSELNKKNGNVVSFKLPANFMNVYRWSSTGINMNGSEWMTQPITIPAGTGKDISFTISVTHIPSPK